MSLEIKLSKIMFQWLYTGKILQNKKLKLKTSVFSMKDRFYKKILKIVSMGLHKKDMKKTRLEI